MDDQETLFAVLDETFHCANEITELVEEGYLDGETLKQKEGVDTADITAFLTERFGAEDDGEETYVVDLGYLKRLGERLVSAADRLIQQEVQRLVAGQEANEAKQ